MKKDTDMVPEQAPLIIFYVQSSVFMSNNGKDNKHTRHISMRIVFKEMVKSTIFTRLLVEVKMYKIDRHTHMRSFGVARTRNCHLLGRWLHWHLPVTYSNYLYRT